MRRAWLRRWLTCAAITTLTSALAAPQAAGQSGAGAPAVAGVATGAPSANAANPVNATNTANAPGLANPATAASTAAALVASEDRVKAASLYKFLNYISWPAASFIKPDAPYVIGVAGADEVVENLEQLVAGRKVADRQVTVRRMRINEALAGMHVLFVGRADRHRLPQILRQLQGQPVLVVTEGESSNVGGMINFRIVDERVRFEVALEAEERSGLKLDSRMLAVAYAVNKGPQQ